MNKEELDEYLVSSNPEALYLDGFDEAIIGTAERINLGPIIAYDIDKIIEILSCDMEISEDDLEDGETIESKKLELAIEYFDYNIIGAWIGEGTPIFIKKNILNKNMYISEDFRNYCVKHLGINGLQVDAWQKLQETIYANNIVTGSMTPYILEERELRVTQMDIFSRMMLDRIIWCAGPVNDRMSTVLQAQLMFLDSIDSKDIIAYIDSPGGSVKSGLSIIDVMDYISVDISTVNTGLAASMGAVLLAKGTKGKRHSLRYSRTMIHQSSGGTEGHILDAKITWQEWEKVNEILFNILSETCDKTPEQIKKDADRDLWFSADEAVAYGIIDSVILTKKKIKTIKK